MLEKIHIYIAVFAAFIVTLAGLIMRTDTFLLALELIIVITVFYIIGLLVRLYLYKKVFPEAELERKRVFNEINAKKSDMKRIVHENTPSNKTENTSSNKTENNETEPDGTELEESEE